MQSSVFGFLGDGGRLPAFVNQVGRAEEGRRARTLSTVRLVIDLPQLRAAIHQRDDARLVALLRAERALDDDQPLQMVGDGLIAALADNVDGAAAMAAAAAARLRDRGWAGDDELADQLESRLGTIPTPMLRPLAVDLEALAMVLEGDPISGGGRIDLQTGEVVHEFTFEDLAEFGEEPDDEDPDPDRWLEVSREGSRGGYGDMVAFIDTLSDSRLVDRLRDAIQGRGAFRRFKDVLSRAPQEFTRWHVFADERQRGRARAWLADKGYRVAPKSAG
jgi:hypothetical protein